MVILSDSILLSQDDCGLDVDGVLHDEDCPCAICEANTARIIGAVGQAPSEHIPTFEELAPWIQEQLQASYDDAVWGVDVSNDELAARIERIHQENEAKAKRDAMADRFNALAQPVTLTDDPILPALLMRDDGRTIFYESRVNSLFGEPGVGKTWVAIMAAIAAVRAGSNVLWWDFEDRASTLATRLAALGAHDVIENDALRFINDRFLDDDPEEENNILPYALAWLMRGQRPGLVVIDSCESAGCPSDGGATKPFFDKFIDPWLRVGATILMLDHVPKRREERPLGPIGSTHKRSRIDGAAIFVTGTPWNKQDGGKLLLVNHKDRAGNLMVSLNKPIATVSVVNTNGDLACTITEPEKEETDSAEIADNLLYEIAKLGSVGVTGSKQVRALVKHKGQTADIALEDLMKAGLVDRYKVGQAWLYYATPEGLEMAEGGD